jgi:hypothetical protein
MWFFLMDSLLAAFGMISYGEVPSLRREFPGCPIRQIDIRVLFY